MPIFEYRCSECNTKFEVLHKSSEKIEDVKCPNCSSGKNRKLLSTFSASINGSNSNSNACYGEGQDCATGACGCGSGMCGLN